MFTCQTARQTCGIGPWLHLRALGSARLPLFALPPNARGGALSTHATDFAVAARVLPGDLAQEVWRILARMNQRSLSAPRGIAPLSRSRAPDQTGVSPRQVCPTTARRTWPGVNVESHARRYRIPSHSHNAS